MEPERSGSCAARRHATRSGQQGVRQWKWTAPERPGTYLVTVEGPGTKDAIAVHAFVMVPAAEVKGGLLNGYRIGAYPPPLHGSPVYRPPPGFVEVTRENQDTKLSPHFQLKQFLCKEDTTKTFPKYVVVQEKLPLKLEAVLERVNELGFTVDTLHEELLRLSMQVNGVQKIPFIWFWPEGAPNCLIMTHDVETAAGRDLAGC